MSHARRLRTASAAALLAAIGLATGAAHSSEALAGDDIQLERTPSGHLLLPVTIGDAGPFPFILDTGASHTAIAAPVAEQLGFRAGRMSMTSRR